MLTQRPTALVGMIILLTDGRQTAGGTDATAIYRAQQAKNSGLKVATINFGNVDQSVRKA